MESQINRLLFAVSVLKQEEDAHQVLSDLLEEEGEQSLAEWARAKKKSWHKRLDFVLGVLPHLMTLQITCDLLAHSLTILEKRGRRQTYAGGVNSESIKGTIAAIKTVGRWAGDNKENKWNWVPEVLMPRPTERMEAALNQISGVWPWRFGIMHIDLTLQSLHLAISSSRFVVDADSEINVRSTIDASRNACRKVVKATRTMLQPFRVKEMERSVSGKLPHKLAQWQVGHAIKVIEAVMD